MRTRLCELLGIDHPVIQAGMSVYTSPGLAAAVSNAGGLGSLGAWNRSVDQLDRDLTELGRLTGAPFAVNHVVPDVDVAAFELTLTRRPAVVSFALDDAGDLVDEVHRAGSLAMQQVTTVGQAVTAAEHGVDIIVAQGGEAGGYSGSIATMPLVPQVVDAVDPVPVVAAGGIADGRGLAAALVLGAVGVNLGSRFLAATEAPVGEGWKKDLVAAQSDEWVQLDFLNKIAPNPGTAGYGTRVRAKRTEFTERWEARIDELDDDPAAALAEMERAAEHGELEQIFVVGGQSAGLIHDIEPAGEIVQRIVREGEQALRSVSVGDR